MSITEPPETPALVVDFVTVQNNLQRMSRYAQQHGLTVRPHIKTHKSILIAKMQIASGAAGLTVAKVGEAQIMAQAFDVGRGDLLMAFPALDATRTSRLAELARSTEIRVAIDSRYAADALVSAAESVNTSIGILIDLDCGSHRTGLQSPQDALELAQYVDRQVSLRLDGLFMFLGHLFVTQEQQAMPLRRLQQYLEVNLELWHKNGLEASVVSGGSTPTAYQSHYVPSLTEIRPGTYVFNDMNTVHGGYCQLEDCAARVVCTVISNAVPGKCVIDAGSKTFSSDRNIPVPESGFGHVVEYPNATITLLSEEHGEVSLSDGDRSPDLGERITVIPNHICVSVNLQEKAWMRCDDATLQPLAIEAQHKLI